VQDAEPGRVVGEQAGDLRDREYEHEVEEQLERADRLLGAQRQAQRDPGPRRARRARRLGSGRRSGPARQIGRVGHAHDALTR
jgi:hypothetical protein